MFLETGCNAVVLIELVQDGGTSTEQTGDTSKVDEPFDGGVTTGTGWLFRESDGGSLEGSDSSWVHCWGVLI